ncbi:unnamed protein product, partial [Adineta steineri]
TISALNNTISLNQTIDGRIVTCSSVNNTDSSYTECSNLQQGGLYFPNGVSCSVWSSTNSYHWDALGFCRALTGSPAATLLAYYDCDTSQTRVVWIASVWSTTADNGFTRTLRCYY